MRLFLRRLFVYFVVPLLVLSVGYEELYRCIPNSYRFKRDYLENMDSVAGLQTLILGASDAYLGINPRYFSAKGFNASNVSQSPMYDAFIFKKYVSHLSDLKYLILVTAYSSFTFELEGSDEDWRVKKYQLYWRSDLHPWWIPKYNLECIRPDDLVFRHYLLGEDFRQCTSTGWGTMYRESGTDVERSGRNTALRHISEYRQDAFNRNRSFYEEIIRLAQERGIQVVLLTPPVYCTYYENIPLKQWNECLQAVDDLCKQYPNCEYWNFLKDTRFVLEDFHDGNHLSEAGTKKLSLLIEADLSRKGSNYIHP